MGEGLDSLHSFCRCLLHRGLITISPITGIINPGGGGPLPIFMESRTVDRLLSNFRFPRAFRKIHSGAVLRIFCSANVQHTRLVTLESKSISFSTLIVGMAKGEGGRHLVPFKSELRRTLDICLRREAHFCSNRYRTFFVQGNKMELSPSSIGCVIGQCLSGIIALGGGDPRILQRAFTASVLGRRTRLRTMGRLLKRRDLAAARICARAAFRRLGRICRRTRPETWEGKNVCKDGGSVRSFQYV